MEELSTPFLFVDFQIWIDFHAMRLQKKTFSRIAGGQKSSCTSPKLPEIEAKVMPAIYDKNIFVIKVGKIRKVLRFEFQLPHSNLGK